MKHSLWRAKRVAKTVLAFVTIGALASAVGMGAYVAPAMLPLLWLAAWDSNLLMKFFWTLLAWPCGLLLGFVTMYPTYTESAELVLQLGTIAVFLLTLVHRPRKSILWDVDHARGGQRP